MEPAVIEFNGLFDDANAAQFVAALDAVTETDTIVIDIESRGGAVNALASMVEAIKAKKAEGFTIVTNVERFAYSCGFMLFLTGDVRLVTPGAELMYHAAGLDIKERITADDAKDIYTILAEADAYTDELLLESTDLTPEMIAFLKRNTSFFTREDLVYLGIMKDEYTLNN